MIRESEKEGRAGAQKNGRCISARKQTGRKTGNQVHYSCNRDMGSVVLNVEDVTGRT